MNHFLICENPACRFILDRRLDGTSLDGVLGLLPRCPECGGSWSAKCPFCSQAVAIELPAEGIPALACCGRRPLLAANAA